MALLHTDPVSRQRAAADVIDHTQAALFYLAAQTLVETDSRTKLFRWAGSVVLAAFVLGAFRVARLFAALLHFARRTLFLYPHLEENLKEHSDGEVLGRLVAKVELPRPNNPGAVRGALDTTTQNEGESEQSLCSLGSYRSEESSQSVWKSNFGRPTPSTRRCRRDRVGSMA